MEQTVREYRDHVIEIRARVPVDAAALGTSPPRPELLIDGNPVSYSRLFDGTFYLMDNAYEWGDDLVALAEKLVDRRDRAEA